jgi:uncharacterized delta-60 repeat protein
VAANMRSVCGPLRTTAIAVPLMLMAAEVAIGAPGDLDPGFGNGGAVFINMDANAEAAAALVQQANGRLLVGRATNFMLATSVDLSVVRLDANGTVDTDFGVKGLASTDIPGITASTQVVVLQGPDKVIVAGPAWRDDNPNRDFFAVARYRGDGTLDATFGDVGYVLEEFGPAHASFGAILVQPDGRLVAAGFVEPTPGVADAAFMRFNVNGSIDTTYGTNGRLIVDLEDAGNADSAYALARRSNGGLIAAIIARTHPVLLSLTADGKVDLSFGVAGRLAPDIANGQMIGSPHLGLQSDGKIVLSGVVMRVGESSCDLRIIRMDEQGHLDSSFGKSGVATLPLRICYSENDVIVASDDSILLLGATEYVSPWDYYGDTCPCVPRVMRMTSNGVLDHAFGMNGEAIIDLGVGGRSSNVDPTFLFGAHVVEQTDGRVVVATTGQYDDENSYLDNGRLWLHQGIAVARLLKSGASPGRIGFRDMLPQVNESQSSAVLYVQRTGGAAGTVSAQFATSDAGAHGGSDYTPAAGTLTWADGETADKAITIAIVDDSMLEGPEQLDVTLASPMGGAFLATSQSGVRIADNDVATSPAPVPTPVPGPSSGVPSSGGGGATGWAQLLALAVVLLAMKRRDRPSNFRLRGQMAH